MPSQADELAPVMSEVERQLANFYDFKIASPASNHLISRKELLTCLGSQASEQPEWQARGGVWLINNDPSEPDEVFIGIHISDEVSDEIAQTDPIQSLSNQNLDAFCVLVEEISHFHLIANRAQAGRPVTRLELEWQGEIDKLLICAMTLQRQSGDLHLLPLARMLYDNSIIVAADQELYWQATKHAARFWYDAIRAKSTNVAELLTVIQSTLKATYNASWSDKLDGLKLRAS